MFKNTSRSQLSIYIIGVWLSYTQIYSVILIHSLGPCAIVCSALRVWLILEFLGILGPEWRPKKHEYHGIYFYVLIHRICDYKPFYTTTKWFLFICVEYHTVLMKWTLNVIHAIGCKLVILWCVEHVDYSELMIVETFPSLDW